MTSLNNPLSFRQRRSCRVRLYQKHHARTSRLGFWISHASSISKHSSGVNLDVTSNAEEDGWGPKSAPSEGLGLISATSDSQHLLSKPRSNPKSSESQSNICPVISSSFRDIAWNLRSAAEVEMALGTISRSEKPDNWRSKKRKGVSKL